MVVKDKPKPPPPHLSRLVRMRRVVPVQSPSQPPRAALLLQEGEGESNQPRWPLTVPLYSTSGFVSKDEAKPRPSPCPEGQQ